MHIAAILGIYLAGAMLVPAMVDLYYGHPDWPIFTASAFMVGGLSLATFMATRMGPPPFSKKFGFVLVNLLWAVFSVVGAIPLWLSSLDLDFAQALFESVSAITTTGGTVIVGLDDAPPGLLVWRSLLCWLGGIGIVVLGLFIIPYLRVGGMSFFKMESSDTSDKPFARLASFSRAFLIVYVVITLLCAIGYFLTGMSRFDAVNHAMSTVATGGFSTHDASFAYFGSIPLLWTATFFMALCSLPFSILIVLVARGRLDALRDPQIIVFLGYLSAFSIAVAVYHRLANGVEFHLALAHSFFNITSILSTSGYASQDYSLWGPSSSWPPSPPPSWAAVPDRRQAASRPIASSCSSTRSGRAQQTRLPQRDLRRALRHKSRRCRHATRDLPVLHHLYPALGLREPRHGCARL